MFNENDHPRDSDGKFTDKNTTPAEHKRLVEMGVESDKVEEILGSNFNLRKEINITDCKTIDNYFEIDNNLLEKQIIEDNNGLNRSGNECILLKNILLEIGYLNKPIVVNSQEYEKLKSKTKTLFRGVPVEDADKEFRDNDNTWIGRGSLVHGIYFSTLNEEATSYSKPEQTEHSVIEILLHPKAKIINYEELNNLDNKERIDSLIYGSEIESKYGKDKAKMYYSDKRGRCRKSIKAALMGYDVIRTSDEHYVILNRSATIMRED